MNSQGRLFWMVLSVLVIIIVILVLLMSVTTAQAATPIDIILERMMGTIVDLRDRVIVLESYHTADPNPYPGPDPLPTSTPAAELTPTNAPTDNPIDPYPTDAPTEDPEEEYPYYKTPTPMPTQEIGPYPGPETSDPIEWLLFLPVMGK